MRNLIDELHNLDEVEYKVSKDFSKNVMKKIHKEQSTSKISKVIPWASLGIAACLAVVVFTNANIKMNFLNGAKESADNSVNQASIYENEFESIDDKQTLTYDYLDNSNELFTPESDSAVNTVNDTSLKQNLSQNTYEESQVDNLGYDSNTPEAGLAVTTNRVQQNKDKLSEMKTLIEKANLEVEEIEGGLKVKASKDKVKDVLIEYTNISIETQNEYVIVKCK